MTAVTTAPTVTTEDRLRTVLRVDGIVTALVGLFGLLGPTSTYGYVPGWLPRALGAGFLLAGALVFVEAKSTGRTLALIGTLTADAAFAWTLASAAILAFADLPARGELIVAVVGLATLAFGITETRLVRALKASVG
jgi:hypothetical protein